MAAWVALLLLVVAGLALLLRADAGSIAGFDPSDFALIVAGVALMIFIGSAVAGSYRGRAGQALRDLMAWSLVALALIAGYSYRETLLSFGHQVLGELLPPGSALRTEAQIEGEQSVRIRKRPDGHFLVWTEANGVKLPMLVDTGASTVVLRPEDGQRLGFDIEQLRYVVPVQTANGTTYAASVRVRSLSVGKIKLNDVDALVAKRGSLRENLLGMSFLNRLKSYEFSGEYLTLRKI
ncbi:MAG TPA: TIGR02281 family clan AA aspartic protease [Hyphomicrobiaceae bacterium]|jgi:aspartyl protease family protein|nr:TIGR02281 family clan AA aspartic protease [Hyphomicrobiaceae bacterium]